MSPHERVLPNFRFFFLKSRDASWLHESVAFLKKYRDLTSVDKGDDQVSPHERVLPNFRFFSKVQGCLVAALLGSPLAKSTAN